MCQDDPQDGLFNSEFRERIEEKKSYVGREGSLSEIHECFVVMSV